MLRSRYWSRDSVDGFNYRLSVFVREDCFLQVESETLVLMDDELELGTLGKA